MIRNIGVLVSANTTSFVSQMGRAGAVTKAFAADVEKSSAKAQVASGKTLSLLQKAGVGGAIALAAIGVASIGMAAKFEQSMRNVNSIAGESEQQFERTSGAVIDMSRRVPQAATTLADGLYDIASSGFQGADALEVLERSAVAASAGMTDTATAAKGITGVLNAYGLEARDAAEVSDVLFQTVNLGVITFEELAGNLGDVVAMTAAAGVGIGQVGSAIATMTLSGINAAESTTALNRLIQKLIDPTEELSALYDALGIDILPDLADEGIGLHGVMEKIREATGGNVGAFQALFGEIRATKGAFGLAANDGENYRRTMAGIGDATNVAGATQRAFDEQMKATSNQFQLLKSDAAAYAITLGSHALPAVRALMEGLGDLARVIASGVGRAADALTPTLDALGASFEHLWAVGTNVVETLAPLAGILANVFGGALVAALQATATSLETVSGFLADHPGLVQAVTIAYGVRLVAALVATTAAFAGLQIGKVAFALAEARIVAGHLIHNLGLLGILSRAAPFAILVGAGAVLARVLEDASDHADKLVQSVSQRIDMSSIDSAQKSARGVREELEALQKRRKELQEGLSGLGGQIVGLFTGAASELRGVQDAIKELEGMHPALQATATHMSENIAAIGNATGLTEDAILQMADALGIDLTQGFGASEGARQQLIDHWDEINAAVKLLGPGMAAAFDEGIVNVDELLAAAQAAGEAAKEVGEKFAEAFALTSFTGNFEEAEESLEGFLTRTLESARTFQSNLQAAIEMGLSPEALNALLVAGPEEASATLQALVDANSSALVEMYNDAAETLSTMQTQVMASSRLIQQAMTADTDDLVANLGAATELSNIKFAALADGVLLSADKIAEQMGITTEEVQTLADMFEITLAPAAEEGKAALGGVGEESEAVTEKLGGLASKLVENQLVLDGHSTQAINNRRAVSDVADAIKNHIGTLEDQGRTMDEKRAAFDRHVGDLRSVLEQAGYTEGAIDALIKKYGLVPENIDTFVSVETAEAERKLAGFRAMVEERDIVQRVRYDVAPNPLTSTPFKSKDVTVRQTGGLIGGSGSGDIVPLMAEPGEFVIRRSAVESVGVSFLERVNRMQSGGLVRGFQDGGQVRGYHDGGWVAPVPVGGGIDYDRLAEAMVRAIDGRPEFVPLHESISIDGDVLARKTSVALLERKRSR